MNPIRIIPAFVFASTLCSLPSVMFAMGIWSQKADFGGTQRYAAAGFSIGSKGYIGTGVDGSVKKDFWEWDKTSNTWTQKADFGGTARYSAVGFSIANKGYIGTGMDATSTRKKDFWEWDGDMTSPTYNTWIQKTNFGGTAREGAVGFSIGTKGYVGMGEESAATYKKDLWEYDQAGNVWIQKTNFGGAARSLPVGFSIGTNGYVGLGIDAAGSVKNDFWEWNQATNAWIQKANFGGVPRYGSIGFSIGNKAYVGVGRDGSLAYKQDFWEWDQGGNTWTQAVNFGGTARNVAVGFSIDNRAYIGTGYDGFYKNDFWEWNPVPVVSAISTNLVCFGQCDGTAAANVSGGTLPYTYLWSNSETTQMVTGLCDGTYTITVMDADSDTSIAIVVITQPASLVASATATAVSCFGGGNGTAEATAAGGTPAYTYLWSNGQNASSATGLSAGNYTASVTDANGCTSTATVNIAEPTALSSVISAQTNILCNGSSTGSAEVSASGGTPAYTYSWSNGASASSATGLSAGNYTASVTDANGCTITVTAAITQPSIISISTATNPANCLAADGDASASVSGGTPGYGYLWSGGQIGSIATGLSAGTYTITVTDANGCTMSNFVNVSNIGGVTISITSSASVTCNGGNDGSAASGISGGSAPYTYSWNTTPVQTTATATGLSAGTYNVVVTDGAGCIGIASVTIGDPSALIISFSQVNISCHGSGTGSAEMSVSGGSPVYTYSWSNGQTTSSATGLSAGNYSFVIVDANGCIISDTVTITEPDELLLSIVSATTICMGSCVTLTASAIGGNAGYSYLWQPGNLTTDVVAPCPTTTIDYTVTVTDMASCMDTAFAAITVNSLPVVVFTLNPDTVCMYSGSFPLTGGLPNGGTYFGTGVVGGNFDPVATGSGIHTISYSYSDTNGCTDSASAQIFVDICTEIQYSFVDLSVLFFPNPSTGIFIVQVGNEQLAVDKMGVEIYNVMGEKVYESLIPKGGNNNTLQSGRQTIDLSSQPKGLYFYHVTLETPGNPSGQSEDAIATGKLVIQ